MGNAQFDDNQRPTLTAVSSVDGTPVAIWADPLTHRLLVDSTSALGGTVTSVSVVSANGITGSVANATSTPAITLTLGAITPTTVNGLALSLGNGNKTYDIAIGPTTLASVTTGQDNTAIGGFALRYTTSGIDNVAVGDNALTYNTTGSYNAALGFGAGSGNFGTAVSSSVFLGYYAGHYSVDSNVFYLDNQNRTNTAGEKIKSLMYGTFNATNTSQTLSVNGKLGILSGDGAYHTILQGGTQAADVTYTLPTALPGSSKILQSDSSGVLSWITNAPGAGASIALDNLVSTDINADLNFAVGRDALLKVKDQTVNDTVGNNFEIWGADGLGSGDGGMVFILGGSGGATSGFGGTVQIEAGNAIGGDSNGGEIDIYTGNGHGAGQGGLVLIFSGAGGATGEGGDIDIEAGDGGLTSGTGGFINIIAGDATAGGENGGSVSLTAGVGKDGGNAGSVGLIGGNSAIGVQDGIGVVLYSDIGVKILNVSTSVSAILDPSLIAASDKTFTFPNVTGTIGTVITKTDTGDPTGVEGAFEINTYDNKFKVYADGAWRQLATW